jgi:hypothetical protein
MSAYTLYDLCNRKKIGSSIIFIKTCNFNLAQLNFVSIYITYVQL